MSNYAGFGRRLAANILDRLFIGVYLLFLLFLVLFLFGDNFIAVEKGILWLLFYLVFCQYFVWNLYLTIFTYLFGGSLGKIFLGLRVVDGLGEKLTFRRAAFRYFVGYFVSGILFGLGFLYIIRNEKKQGFHDKISGSYVVSSGQLVWLKFVIFFISLILAGGVLASGSYNIIVNKSVLVQIAWQIQDETRRFDKFFKEVQKLEQKNINSLDYKDKLEEMPFNFGDEL